jgi:VanZ family protein
VKARYWLPAALWTCVILLASSDFFSGAQTAGWLQPLISTIVGHSLPAAQFERIHFLVRKSAHLTEYAILGALLFRAVRGERQQWSLRWSTAAVVLAAVVASADEWHQTFIPSRTGALSDVVLDTVGATLAQILIRAAQVLFFKA